MKSFRLRFDTLKLIMFLFVLTPFLMAAVPPSDSDGDGVDDVDDVIVNSDMRPFVDVYGCQTDTPNRVNEFGFTIQDLVNDAEDPGELFFLITLRMYEPDGEIIVLPLLNVFEVRAISACIGDEDADGVPDFIDEVPNSDNSLYVTINGCQSIAPNLPFAFFAGAGLTVQEAFEFICEGDAECIAGGLEFFVGNGLWTEQEALSTVACALGDEDEDTVPDDDDLCPGSNPTPTLVINGCDTGVANTADANGCTLSDKLTDCESSTMTWQYANCVSARTNQMVKDGELTSAERSAIMACVWEWGKPNPVDDTYTTDWTTTLEVPANGVLANDTDPQGNTLQAHLLTGPSSGHLNLNQDGSFTYVPVSGETGAVPFVYKAWDGSSYRTATVTINVTTGNQAPIALDDTASTEPNTRLNIAAPGVLGNDSDPEGETLTAHLVSTTSNGHLGFHEDGSFWYEPNTGFTGTDSFVYKVTDGVNVSYATVTLEVGSGLSCITECSQLPEGTYYGPSCQGCNMFVQCDQFGQLFEMQCPPGLVWDNDLVTCVADTGQCAPD